MGIRKVCVVITARPSYSRVKTVLDAIMNHAKLELQLVVAASALLDRYGKVIDQIESDGFSITSKVYMVLEGENPLTSAKTTGGGILELSTVFDNLQPDMVISIADRYETMATAIAASYMNIPLVHIQGGEVTGSIDEKVRHAITKLSDTHLVATEKAKERVIKMGENPNKVFNTGCPSIDLAAMILENSTLDYHPFDKYGGVGNEFDYSQGYIIVMQHPVTYEYKRAKEQVTQTLEAVNELGIPTFWFWPNVDAGSDETSTGIRIFREHHNPKNIRFFKNMSPNDFLKLLYNSRCIVGNSSVAIRECSFLGVPAVNIGYRQNRRERGLNVVDAPYDKKQIIEAIEKQLEHGHYKSDNLYGKGDAGKAIAEIISDMDLSCEKFITY